MTETATNFASKAIQVAGERTEKTRKILRRNGLAYLGLHGMAFDQAKASAEKLRADREDFFKDLVAKGEDIETGVVKFFKGTQGKAEDLVDDTRERVWNLLPGSTVNRIEDLEADVEAARKKLQTLTKTAQKTARKTVKKTPAKAKKTTTKTVKTTKAAAKPVVKAAPKPAARTAPAAKVSTPAKAASTPTPKPARVKPAQPRHIPYFNDVKRYDPFANEDIVRKIVNHCGIALSSEDARYVACTDETERNRVRDSWLKKKLDVQGTDTDLDRKVQNVCSIMQRDNRKNRVKFYYLAAKAERKLEAI